MNKVKMALIYVGALNILISAIVMIVTGFRIGRLVIICIGAVLVIVGLFWPNKEKTTNDNKI